jgi:hypothetical protein
MWRTFRVGVNRDETVAPVQFSAQNTRLTQSVPSEVLTPVVKKSFILGILHRTVSSSEKRFILNRVHGTASQEIELYNIRRSCPRRSQIPKEASERRSNLQDHENLVTWTREASVAVLNTLKAILWRSDGNAQTKFATGTNKLKLKWLSSYVHVWSEVKLFPQQA